MDMPHYYFNILVFFLVGIILGIILDFFRGIRRIKKTSNHIVLIQDIIFGIVMFCVIAIAMYMFLDDNFRFYIIVSIILGIILYLKTISKFVIKIYIIFFKSVKNILGFIITPIKIWGSLCKKIINILKKCVKKCCIFFSNMIHYLCNVVIMLPKKSQKKKVENEKKSRKKIKI